MVLEKGFFFFSSKSLNVNAKRKQETGANDWRLYKDQDSELTILWDCIFNKQYPWDFLASAIEHLGLNINFV
jgi:hypothetical protein